MIIKSTALANDSASSTSPNLDTAADWIFGTAAFAVEIALAVAAATAGYRLVAARSSSFLAAIVAGIALASLIAIWATWMSPNADHRLDTIGRLILGCLLIALVAGGLIGAGASTFGWILGIAGVIITVAAQIALG